MRLLKEIPEVETQIQTGELSLSVISQAQTFFKNESLDLEKKKEVLGKLQNKSSREAEKILVGMSSHAHPAPDKKRPLAPNQTELKFVVSDEMLQDLERLKNLLSHQLPNATLSELFHYALKLALKKLDPEVKLEKPLPTSVVTTRYVSKSVKTYLWQRDQGRCTYVDSKTGRKCNSQFKLEIDHKHPYSLGGETSPENLRLLCKTHNQLEARNVFGDWVRKYNKDRK